jgi:SAM-dependent methyltransferase
VLEHLDDDLASIKNVYYILKPGGYFIITVPAFNFLWSGHDAAMHHKRRYGKKDLVRRLKSCDFSVEICTFWNFFLFPAVAVIRVLRDRRRCDLITDLKDLPQIVNRLLLQILRVENILIGGGIPFPFGVSILCICRKGGN